MEGKSCLFLFWFVIDELMPPKKGHILNPGTCILYIMLYSKKKFAHMIKLRILRWEDTPAWITQFSCACVLRDSHSQFSGNQDSATTWTIATRLLSMGFPRQGQWVRCHFLLQGIFSTQRSNLCLLCTLHQQVDSLPLRHLGSLSSHTWEKKQRVRVGDVRTESRD